MAEDTAAGEAVMNGMEFNGGGRDEAWPVMQSLDDAAMPELISPDKLLRYLDEVEKAEVVEDDGPVQDDGPVPRITKMPDSVMVEERRVGRAVAQWVVQVRCDCGRRWFEADIVDTATCPRCGVLVYVDMDAHSAHP
jgi:hypothetical protein